MRQWRRASAMRRHFQLAELVPGRIGQPGAEIAARPGLGLRQRIWPEPVGSARPPQLEGLDKAPDAEDETDKPDEKHRVRLVEPMRDFRKQHGKSAEGDDPPAALVAVVQPLDRGGSIDPRADGDQWIGNRLKQYGKRRRDRRRGLVEAVGEREQRSHQNEHSDDHEINARASIWRD